MFSKRKSNEKQNRSNKNLSQFGLFDIPTNLSFEEGEVKNYESDDSDLEAELLALSGSSSHKKKKTPTPIPQANLDSMISASLRDIPSDDELSEGDDDLELLSELNELSGLNQIQSPPNLTTSASDSSTTKLLLDRLKIYEIAEAKAKSTGESSRARRFGRGIKTLKDLIKQSQAGKPVNNEDIPPEINISVAKPRDAELNKLENTDKTETNDTTPPVLSPLRKAPSPPPKVSNLEESEVPNEEKQQLLTLLNTRKNEYKSAAVVAKKAGDTTTALNYVKIVKQFEAVIKAVENNEEVDVSGMPGPPSPVAPKTEENKVQTQENLENQENITEETLITANSVEEALDQRLQVYKQQQEAATEKGNSGKARRMGRIVKQYEDAIKMNRAGKPIPVDELPTPPGYAPIPVPGSTLPPSQMPKPVEDSKSSTDTPINKPSTPKNSISAGGHAKSTRAEKQVQFLLARQKEFKIAALNAKKKGELEQAKEFLRTAKGFDPLLEASYAGLPVDITSLPVPPSSRSQLDNEYELIMAEECTEEDTDLDVLSRLETQLNKQLKMCLSTRDHNKAIGDVTGTNRFEQLALTVTKDLDVIRLARRTPGSPIPKFHYQKKEFSIVKTITELNDNDLEITIARGINYNCSNPKDVDTYVKFEFPYPQEEPVRDKTSTVRDTNNPEYNAVFTLPIQRSARTCLRVFKRHSIKFEVFSKGGFLRSDTLLGTVSVKLLPLETQCEIHDSFDLMDGRKKAGGKLEIKVRVRNPLHTKQVEQISEKWLIIDH